MTRTARRSLRSFAAAGLAAGLFAAPACAADGAAAVTPPPEAAAPAAAVPAPMSFDAARERTFAWAAKKAGGTSPPDAVAALWSEASPSLAGRELHALVIRSFAAGDPAAAEFLAAFDLTRTPTPAVDPAPLAGPSGDPFYATNLSLEAARYLTDARMFDEALPLFTAADLAQAVDPASALFYQAVCEHQLMLAAEGLATIERLRSVGDVPESYAAVARLMEADLKALKPDSLAEVAGMMKDVERRLELARGGKKVQDREGEIVKKLDGMIKKIEEQMQRQSASGPGNGSGSRPSNPLGESTVKGSTAPGEVDDKTRRRDGNWGGLPPREREQAKTELDKAYPSTYRRLIDEYFLKRSKAVPAD